MRVSTSKTRNGTTATLACGPDLDQRHADRQALLAYGVRGRVPAQPGGGKRVVVEHARVDSAGVGQERTATGRQVARDRARDRVEGVAIVEQLCGEHEVEARGEWKARGIGRDQPDRRGTVRGGARANESERVRNAIDERDVGAAARGGHARQAEAAPELEHGATPRRHRGREHVRATPHVRPVRRLRRIVAGEQRGPVDVAFEIRDLPEKNVLAPDDDGAELALKFFDAHSSEKYCHSQGLVLSRTPTSEDAWKTWFGRPIS